MSSKEKISKISFSQFSSYKSETQEDKPSLEIGIKGPVENLNEKSKYKESCDGMIVYIYPDGTLSLKPRTILRGVKVGEIFYDTLKKLNIKREEKTSLVFMIVCNESTLVNYDCEKVNPALVFIGGLDKENFYLPENFSLDKNLFLPRSRKEIYENTDSNKIYIAKDITYNEAKKIFDNNGAVIEIEKGKKPEKRYNSKYYENLLKVSDTRTNGQILVRNIKYRSKEYIDNKEFIKVILCEIDKTIEELKKINVVKNWKKEKDNIENALVKYLVLIEKIENKEIVFYNNNIQPAKKCLPFNYTKTNKLKVSKSFFQKIFDNESRDLVYKMLKDIKFFN